MPSGRIRPETRTLEVDRSNEAYAVWEAVASAPPDLPWAAAPSLAVADVAALLSTCRTAVLVVGRPAAATALLEHTLASLPPVCRLYLYASRAVETDARLKQRLGKLSKQVLARLGFDAPADWLVVDEGRRGLLLVGPPSEERRWIVPVDGPLARTLHEAARVLFWFHATREGLPDTAGTHAFRAPLPAPFLAPERVVALRSGQLAITGDLPTSILDAELRVATHREVPGRAGVVFLRPDPTDFVGPVRLAGGATKVVWADTGLPATAVSRERFVLDLVEAPISLQLEWPKQEAIELYHRLSKAARTPAWQFHPQRRLAEISGQVLLEGATKPADVQSSVVVPAPDEIVSLEAFNAPRSDGFPPAPKLARRVTYQWTARPRALPPEAREASLVRGWRTVDEWARRQVDSLGRALDTLEREERGILDRLRRWLTGHDDLRKRRGRLHEQVQELAEALPSERGEEASGHVQRIAEAGHAVRELVEQAHGARARAETEAAEEQQRSEWEARVQRATAELGAQHDALASIEQREAAAANTLAERERQLADAVQARRETRRAALTEERAALAAALADARREHEALTKQGAPKQQRKEAGRKAHELEQRLARPKRELEAVPRWVPPPAELSEERAAVDGARRDQAAIQEEARTVKGELRRLEQLASEELVFKAPPRQPSAPPLEVAAPPPVPGEVLPELGELFEHRGTRYLAVKTWEQVPRAIPVARRLRAELVSMVDDNK